MIKLRWLPFPESNVSDYRVYRSIIGFRAPLVSLATLNSLTLQLKINGGALQTFTFDAVTAVVDKINATIIEGTAYLSNVDSNFFFIRSNVRETPGSVQIVGGTAMALFSLTARLILQKSEDFLIAQIPALLDPTVTVEYQDPDGVLQDWYAISTVDSLTNESIKTAFRQPITTTGPVCVLEGIVVDIQGARLPDAKVTARLVKFPHSSGVATGVSVAPVTTLTGPDGRFSLPLLQCALVTLEIPVLKFAKQITVPAKGFEFITDLTVDLDYRYPLGTEV